MEDRFALNKCGSKWLSMGIKPELDGNFAHTIRLVDKDGPFLSFTKAEFKFLIKLIMDLPEIDERVELEPGIKSTKDMSIVKSLYSNEMYEITHETDITSYSKFTIADSTLARILQIYEFIMLVFNNITVERVENEFKKIVKEAKSKLSVEAGNKKENLRKFFIEFLTKINYSNNFDMKYAIVCDIQANFEDFFLKFLERNAV